MSGVSVSTCQGRRVLVRRFLPPTRPPFTCLAPPEPLSAPAQKTTEKPQQQGGRTVPARSLRPLHYPAAWGGRGGGAQPCLLPGEWGVSRPCTPALGLGFCWPLPTPSHRSKPLQSWEVPGTELSSEPGAAATGPPQAMACLLLASGLPAKGQSSSWGLCPAPLSPPHGAGAGGGAHQLPPPARGGELLPACDGTAHTRPAPAGCRPGRPSCLCHKLLGHLGHFPCPLVCLGGSSSQQGLSQCVCSTQHQGPRSSAGAPWGCRKTQRKEQEPQTHRAAALTALQQNFLWLQSGRCSSASTCLSIMGWGAPYCRDLCPLTQGLRERPGAGPCTSLPFGTGDWL